MTSRPGFACAVVMLALLGPMPAPARAAEARSDSTRADSNAVAPRTAEERAELPTGAAHGWQTGAFRPDRLEHASLSFALSAGVGAVTRRPGVGAGTALVLGFGKELLDDHVDGGDLAADAVGAALAALLVAAITRGANP
jgi:hypothetical protein